jgi:hypothetical protein
MTTLHGGPLDGEEMDLAWATPAELRDGLALICERGIYGPGGRSLYSPSRGRECRRAEEVLPAGRLLRGRRSGLG